MPALALPVPTWGLWGWKGSVGADPNPDRCCARSCFSCRNIAVGDWPVGPSVSYITIAPPGDDESDRPMVAGMPPADELEAMSESEVAMAPDY